MRATATALLFALVPVAPPPTADTVTLFPEVSQVSYFQFDAAQGRFVIRPTASGGLYSGPSDLSRPAAPVSPSGAKPQQVATDGRNVVWVNGYSRLMRTSLDSGRTEQIAKLDPDALLFSVAVSGQNVAWAQLRGSAWEVVLRRPDGAQVTLTDQGWQPSVNATTVAYRTWDPARQMFAPALYDIATGTTKVIPVPGVHGNVSNVVLAGDSVVWVQNSQDQQVPVLKRARSDGSAVTDLVPPGAAFVPEQGFLDAKDRWVAYTSKVAGTSKVIVVPLRGGTPTRASCDPGTQTMPRVDADRRVLWVRNTGGHTDLVTQADPALKLTC